MPKAIDCTLEDEDALARTILGESSGESPVGEVGVAWAVRNRVEADLGHDGKPDWWGEGVTEVCHKSGQFSCWNANDRNRARILAADESDPVFRRCQQIAHDVLGGLIEDPTKGATHYCTINSYPNWTHGLTPCVVIGHHKFFNNVP